MVYVAKVMSIVRASGTDAGNPPAIVPVHVLTVAACVQLVGARGLPGAVERGEIAVERAVAGTRDELGGPLRVVAPLDFGVHVCAPVIRELAAAHPELRVSLRLADDVVDLLAGGVDAAIRVGDPGDGSLTMRVLGAIPGGVFASPAWAPARTLVTPADLAGVGAVLFDSPLFGARWRLERDGSVEEIEVDPRYTVNSLAAVRDAAVAGIGPARLPECVARPALADGSLVRLLPDWTTGRRKVFLVHLGGRRPSRNVEALATWLGAAADAGRFS